MTHTDSLSTRQVWRTPKAGALSHLRLESCALNELSANKVRIEVKAVGLNFADIFALTGLYSATPDGAFIPGLEFSGVVTEVGLGCYQYRVGDRVMGVSRFGGYASVIDSEEDYLLYLPDGWPFSQGAAYIVQTLTAWYALNELGNLKPKQKVLIHSAAGGVGLQAMKLVRALGAHPVGTVSDDIKARFLNNLGFDRVLLRQPKFARQLEDEHLRI